MSEKTRIGIIGTGGRGTLSFAAIFSERPDVVVAAFADTNAERLRLAKEKFGGTAKTYTDFREMVKDPSLDAIVVTTPDYLHRDAAVAALKAGKHVLCDKPLSITVAGCRDIANAARESGKIVDMGFNLRHDIVTRKIKELVDGGAAGKVFAIDNRDYYEGGRTYMARWNRLQKNSGGLFCHKGSHDFDLLNWLNPGGIPLKVAAFAGVNVLNPQGIPFPLEAGEKAGPYCAACAVKAKCPDRFDIESDPFFATPAARADGYNRDTCIYLSDKDTHDNGIAIVEYDNGVRATHWEVFVTPRSTRQFVIMGDRGQIEADLEECRVTVYPRWTRDRIDYHLGRPEGGHGGADPTMCDTFLKNLRAGKKPAATIRDGVMSVAIAEAAEKSRREARVVMIEELLPKKELLGLFA